MHKYKFHGDPNRFEIVAEFVENKYKSRIQYIADVAGGQGMLTRLLRKKNYEAEVVDPRGKEYHRARRNLSQALPIITI